MHLKLLHCLAQCFNVQTVYACKQWKFCIDQIQNTAINLAAHTWRPLLSATNTMGIGIVWLPSLAELRLLVLLDDVPSPLSNSRRLAPLPAAGELKRSAALGDAAALVIGTKSVHTFNRVFAIPLISTQKMTNFICAVFFKCNTLRQLQHNGYSGVVPNTCLPAFSSCCSFLLSLKHFLGLITIKKFNS